MREDPDLESHAQKRETQASLHESILRLFFSPINDPRRTTLA